MSPALLSALFRTPNPFALGQLTRDIRAFLRLHFLYAASNSGLLEALKTPASAQQLKVALDAVRPELLDALLEVGVALKELACDRGVYRIRGRRSRALTTAEGETLAAFIAEYVTYHGSVYRHLAARLRGAELGNYLEGSGEMIARSSRVIEPFMQWFVMKVVGRSTQKRLLEVGCGSGVYLYQAAQVNPNVTGLAIDVQPDVVNEATSNMAKWGLADRFSVELADALEPPPHIAGPFDVITLYNNVYYFTVEQRRRLFSQFKRWLAPGGGVAVVSMMRGGTVPATDFDLILRSTIGCTPLPDLNELCLELKQAGLQHIERVKLMPIEPLWGIIARPAETSVIPSNLQ
jgi:SAM-dependent methyltransferase